MTGVMGYVEEWQQQPWTAGASGATRPTPPTVTGTLTSQCSGSCQLLENPHVRKRTYTRTQAHVRLLLKQDCNDYCYVIPFILT